MENTSEAFPLFPVFLLVDVSASMSGGPINALNAGLPDLKRAIEDDLTVGEIARISLTTFSDQARVVLPLCDLAYAELDEMIVEGGTNFAAAFRGVRDAIEDGLTSLPKGTKVYRPVVFFMSDGAHMASEDWEPPLRALLDPAWKFSPEIVTFGFADAGDDVAALQKIATRFAFLSKDADPAVQVREILKALIGSIRTTSRSFKDPNQADGLHLEASTDYFTPLKPIDL